MNSKSPDILSFCSFVCSKGGGFLRHPVNFHMKDFEVEISKPDSMKLKTTQKELHTCF